MDLIEFIESSNQCTDPDELTRLFLKFLAPYGLDRFVLSEMSHDSTHRKESLHGMLVNYPDEWMRHYIANHYIDDDPVYQGVLRSLVPVTWRQVTQSTLVNPKGQKVMNEARECGLHEGIGLSIRLPGGRVIGVGVCGSASGIELGRNAVSMINAASNQLFLAFSDLLQGQSKGEVEHPALTAREQEILLWLARGKTRTDIADICMISESGVKRHCERIFVKLEAKNVTQAVVKGLRLGLIHHY